MRLLKKIAKEILFFKIKLKNKTKIKKSLSIINPQYFSFGKNVNIGKYCKLHCFDKYENKSYNPSIFIDDNAYIGDFFSIITASNIVIKKNALIASNVLLCGLNHGFKEINVPFTKQAIISRGIIIGENCWIGEKVIILDGVQIGDNCVIGAGSVVTKSIPSNCIVGGNPAKILKIYNTKEKTWEKYNF